MLLEAYAYVFFWIGLSAGVILYNKYILSTFGFPFPIALTMIHMGCCSALAFIGVRHLKLVEPVGMSSAVYVQRIVPIAFLFSVVLWFGNSAYMYLSVSFIQMVKALMPCVVFITACVMKVENFSWTTMSNMGFIALGVGIASYGEINFNLLGFLYLSGSVLAEAFRVISIQILLSSADIKLNSITTLYYVSPACFVFLIFPFALLEAPQMMSGVYSPNDSSDEIKPINYDLAVLGSNAVLAFGLNFSVYLLIGKTSALTMNVAGPVKDWILIYLSSVLFVAPIARLQILGYMLAFAAVCFYNYSKYKERAVPINKGNVDAADSTGAVEK
jgi:hypothetical protein